jgi:hypothetical protein
MSSPIVPNNIHRQVFVRFQKEGIHAYPEAATNPALKTGDDMDVSFLASPHRHMFHFEVRIEVFHDDRDLEFIQEKRFMEKLYNTGALELDRKSCEMLADELYEHLKKRYAGQRRRITILVSEDNENGCITNYDTPT